jgi:glycosyltransferase involved in cell wall biosynthesis
VVAMWGDIRVGYLHDGMLNFLRGVLPLMEMRNISCKFEVLARSEPSPELISLQNDFPGRVDVLGWVDDIRAKLAAARVIVLADANGTGLKNRTIFALASGRPVLGTKFAFEGINVRNYYEGVRVDSAVAFAQLLPAMLARPSLLTRIGLRGARFARHEFGTREVIEKWERTYAVSKT